MPIRNQIAAIVQTLAASPTFLYGTAAELNALADDAAFPCIFMYPPQSIELSPQINGAVDNSFTLNLEFLYQTQFGHYTADNEQYVWQALQMANEFITKAATYRESSSRFFKIKAGEKAKCTPVYNKFNVNTTGVALSITLAMVRS